MPLRPEVTDVLACPKCHGPISLRSDESAFVCEACRLAYKVEDSIPNFLIDEAEPVDGSAGSR